MCHFHFKFLKQILAHGVCVCVCLRHSGIVKFLIYSSIFTVATATSGTGIIGCRAELLSLWLLLCIFRLKAKQAIFIWFCCWQWIQTDTNTHCELWKGIYIYIYSIGVCVWKINGTHSNRVSSSLSPTLYSHLLCQNTSTSNNNGIKWRLDWFPSINKYI